MQSHAVPCSVPCSAMSASSDKFTQQLREKVELMPESCWELQVIQQFDGTTKHAREDHVHLIPLFVVELPDLSEASWANVCEKVETHSTAAISCFGYILILFDTCNEINKSLL